MEIQVQQVQQERQVQQAEQVQQEQQEQVLPESQLKRIFCISNIFILMVLLVPLLH